MNGTDGLLWKSALEAARAHLRGFQAGPEQRKDLVLDRADEKRDTLLTSEDLRPVQAGQGI